MKILISHTNYPAQFRRLLPGLVKAGHEVVFLCQGREWHAPAVENFKLMVYTPHRAGGGAVIHPYLRRFEQAVLQGQAAYRQAETLAKTHWYPDLIINHVGFGSGLYLGDLFPNAKKIGLFEWYYNAEGADVDFIRRGPVDAERKLMLRTWNAQTLLELASCDNAVTPTKWQRDQFPRHLRSHLTVIHEGIDTEMLGNLRSTGMPLPEALKNQQNLEIITYVSRGFEEYRGFPQAMLAISELQRRRPNAHALIVGHDGVAYGANRSDNRSWGQWAVEEAGLNIDRTHWLGILQDAEYHQVLACSTVHLYLTVPFVLSWSLLEAMAAGCALVASDTAPVQEVLEHGRSGLLVDFFDPSAQAGAIEYLLDRPSEREKFANCAKSRSSNYSHRLGLQAWGKLIGDEFTI